MRKFNYKIAVVMVIIGLLLTGCQDSDPVVTIGESEFMPGVYLAAQLGAYYEVYADFSYNTDFLEDSYEDGTSATDKITMITDDYLKMIAYSKVHFDDAGKTLTEEQQIIFDQNFDYQYTGQEEFYSANGIGEDSFYSYLLGLEKFRALYEEQYYDEGESAPTLEEIAEYYGENYTPITRIEISTLSTDYSPLDETMIAEQRDIADDILAEIEENGDFDAAVEKFMPDAIANTGSEYVEDNPGQYYREDIVNVENTTYSEEETATISAEQPGTVGILEQENGFIVYRVEEDYEDISEMEIYRDSMTDEMFYDEFEAAAIAEASGYETTHDTAARNYYSVDKVS